MALGIAAPAVSAGYEDWIAIDEAAAYLAIPVRTLYRLAQNGRLPGTKVGRTWRFKRSLLDAHLADVHPVSLVASALPPAPAAAPPSVAAAAPPAPAPVLPSVLPASPDPVLTVVSALADLSIGLSALLDADEIAAFVAERLQAIFRPDLTCLLLCEETPDGEVLRTAATAGDLPGRTALALPVGASPVLDRAIRDGHPLAFHHDPSASAPEGDELFGLGLRSGAIAPFRTPDGRTGLIALLTARRRRFTPPELERLVAVAGQLGTALTNAKLLADARRWADQLEGIEGLSRSLSHSHEIATVARIVVDGVDALIEVDGIRFYVLVSDGVTLEPVALRGNHEYYADERADDVRLQLGVGLGGAIAVSGRGEVVPDVLRDPRMQDIPGSADVDESMVVVPLLYEDQVMGVLELSRLGLSAFTDEDLRLTQILAAQAAVAIAEARRHEELRDRTNRLERQLASQRQLLAITEGLLKTRRAADVFEAIADTLSEVVPYDTLTIYLVDRERGWLAPVLARDEYAGAILDSPLAIGAGITGDVVERGEAEIVNDADQDPRVVQVPGTPPEREAIAVAPLQSPSGAIGAINLYRQGGRFDADDLELLKLYANHAAIALENARVHERLVEDARTDPLTGVLHHGAFRHALAAALTTASPVSVLMLDLDGFKAYNDRYGHQAGDRLLQRVAAEVGSRLRASDLLCRYGGDEFSLVLPGTDEAGATAVAAKVLDAVRAASGGRSPSVGGSIGHATFPADARDATELIGLADTALYLAKQTGKGRAVAAGVVPTHLQRVGAVLDEAMQHVTVSAAPQDRGDVHPTVDLVGLLRPLHAVLRSEAPLVAHHAATTADLAGRIAARLGLGVHEQRRVVAASLVCDIGRLGSDGVETGQQGAIAAAHPVIAARLLGRHRALREVAALVRHHHERWDGAGYPDGLSGEQLPLGVRAIGAAGRYAALTAGYPGTAPVPEDRAIEIVTHESGGRLAPDGVAALLAELSTSVGGSVNR